MTKAASSLNKNPVSGWARDFLCMRKSVFMMDDKDRENQQPEPTTGTHKVDNPFDNGRTVEEDVKAAGLELDAEQQFKEAQTERD